MYPARQSTHIDLETYLLALGDDIGDVLADGSRTLLINVDPIAVPAQTAESIGAIVRAAIGALAWGADRDGQVIEVGCGANRDGSLTLVVRDEDGGRRNIASDGIAALVGRFGTRMLIETNAGLRCTVVIPREFALI